MYIYMCALFSNTTPSLPQGSSSRSAAPRQQWRRVLWSCRDTFRLQLGRLLVHSLGPARPLEDRRQALEFVLEPSHPDILRECLSPGLEVRAAAATRCLRRTGCSYGVVAGF